MISIPVNYDAFGERADESERRVSIGTLSYMAPETLMGWTRRAGEQLHPLFTLLFQAH